MPVTDVTLRHGVKASKSVASFACSTPIVRDDGTVQVKLSVNAEAEHLYRLHPGDTFSVRDETWKLDRVQGARTDDWRVYLVRVS